MIRIIQDFHPILGSRYQDHLIGRIDKIMRGLFLIKKSKALQFLYRKIILVIWAGKVLILGVAVEVLLKTK